MPPAPAEPLPPETEVVYVEASPPPELVAAREALAAPTLELARTILDAAGQVDAVRHEVSRGSAQADVLTAAVGDAGEVEAMAGNLRDAAAEVAEDLDAPREAARALADLGEAVAGEIRQDLAGLEPHVAHDIAVDAVVEGWSSRGSRTEIVSRFDALVDESAVLVPAAAALEDFPPGCHTLRDNRMAWAAAVHAKTIELRARAAEFDGPEFDELVTRYALAPRGEDQVVADAEGRPCWAESTTLLAVPDRVQDAVEALEDALNS